MTTPIREMGPCPKCSRHVFLPEGGCPFCGAAWTLSRRDFGIAAVAATAAIIAPAADAHGRQEQAKYGVQRPEPPPVKPPRPDAEAEVALIWTPLMSNWMEEAGLLSHGKSWSAHKVGTVLALTATASGRPASFTATYRLAKRNDAVVNLEVAFPGVKPFERAVGCLDGIDKEAKVTNDGKETVEVDGKKFECDVKAYELPGKSFRVWWTKDAPLGFAKATAGDETTLLVKTAEKLEIGKKTFTCSLWETKRGDRTIKTWRYADIPGGIAQSVESLKGVETSKIVATELTEGK